jgi:DNA-binding helix-hairpin-helix protein with protein kinase domain
VKLKDNYGAAIHLVADVARGGEAVIYRVQGRPDALAKIYSPPRPSYKQKLTWMRANPPEDPSRASGHASIAWPRELLFDADNRLAGYLMPFVADAVQLLEVFNPRRRSRILPGFDRRYLHRTARNLVAAVAALHRRGYVIGDLNQSNVLVTPRALVTLIDTDSFQVQHVGENQIVTYPCPVGMVEYTPPELQGQAFRTIVRQPEHDRFGLAVLVFQLLMDGSHPYRSQWLGPGEPPPLEQKIAEGWWPYCRPPLKHLAPPETAPLLDVLHPRLADLTRHCFIDGQVSPRRRPSAEEWEVALAQAEDDLVTCRNGHLVAGHLSRCPRCGARRPGRRGAVAAASSTPPRRSAAATATTMPVAAPAAVGAGAVATVARAPVRLAQGVGRTARQVGEEIHAAVLAVPIGLASVPAMVFRTTFQTAFFLLLAPLRPATTAQTLQRARVTLRRTATLILGSAVAAAASGLALATVGGGLFAGTSAAAPPAPPGMFGLAAAIGGLALTASAAFRNLELAVEIGLVRGMLRRAILRGLAGAVGWTLGWLLAQTVARLLVGETAVPATWAEGTAELWAPVWTLGWAVFGAVGGVSIGALGERWSSWATMAALFGLVGWLMLRLFVGLAGP